MPPKYEVKDGEVQNNASPSTSTSDASDTATNVMIREMERRVSSASFSKREFSGPFDSMDRHNDTHHVSIRKMAGAREDAFGKKAPGQSPEENEDNQDDDEGFLQFAENHTEKDSHLLIGLLFLCLTAASTAAFAFLYTSRLEDDAISTSSAASSRTPIISLYHVQRELHHRFDMLQEVFQAECEDITAFSIASQANWPYWSLDDFERRGSHIQHLAPAVSTLGLAPIVLPDQVPTWERYSVYKGATDLKHDLLWDEIRGDLMGTALAPISQTSPHSNKLINYDLFSISEDLNSLSSAAMDDHSLPIGGLTDWIPSDSLVFQTLSNLDSPHSLWVQPINDPGEGSLKAVLFAVFSWKVFLNDALMGLPTNGDDALQVFLSNSCGEHQFEYTTHHIEQIQVRPQADEPSLLTTLNNQSHSLCHYYIELRDQSSDQELQDQFTKISPIGFACTVATVLLITGSLMLAYLRRLQDHHHRVQQLATHASGVLLSMFPRPVCERILQEAAQREEREQVKMKLLKRYTRGDLSMDMMSCSTGTSRSFGRQKRRESKEFSGHLSASDLDVSLASSNAEQMDDMAESEIIDNMLLESLQHNSQFKGKPIADLFPEATVLFADIVGFTAWSSSRCPTHVFDLLETIYHTFDNIARRRLVFKVETIGDCYVAVTGIPNPRKDHATLMVRFARDCLHAFDLVVGNLEALLGPDTADLSMRFGLHSGPVTAGVLRGERSRFQLFGDTVNVAARMESNSKPGRVHISQQTAHYLAGDNKSSWFLHREDKIHAKGKGELQTYWVDIHAIDAQNKMMREAHAAGAGLIHPTLQQASRIAEARKACREQNKDLVPEKTQRLIDWQVDQLHKLLLNIAARRKQLESRGSRPDSNNVIPQATVAQSEVTVFDEVKEAIEMPDFDPSLGPLDPTSVKLDPNVLWQLNDYVTTISTLYRDNPFHNWYHCSHVTLSVTKMLRRIVSGPQDDELRHSLTGSDMMLASLAEDEEEDQQVEPEENGAQEHTSSADKSFGIASDPLTQFTVVFAALIHDVDHLGVSNAQLVKENDRLARIYKNQSVAEQNSLNLAWDLLMDPSFSELRKSIYSTGEEYNQFRSMLINTVMATDIVDKDLKQLRNSRWEKTFAGQGDVFLHQTKEVSAEDTKENRNRKATIVLEHLIQASDVAHTMQHWHVYQKWNFLLFQEMYIAYKKNRMEKNPLDFWYAGELGFFDFYIIPLAKKLKDCGVFGVSCDEYLNYAVGNRAEWEERGEHIVENYRVWAAEYDLGVKRKSEKRSSFSLTGPAA